MLYDDFNITEKEDQVKTVTYKRPFDHFAAEFIEKLKNYRLIEE